MKHATGEELEKQIRDSCLKLQSIIGSTIGPRGQNVLLSRKDSSPVITKDGVTISEFIDSANELESSLFQVIKQAARKTANNAGDGTSTTTVLATELVIKSKLFMSQGVPPVEIRRGLTKCLDWIESHIKYNFSKPIKTREDIYNIAHVSSNNDHEIAELLASAIEAIGEDGSLTVEDAKQRRSSLDYREGFSIPGGLSSPALVTDTRRGQTVLEDALIFVTDERITRMDQIMPVLQIAVAAKKPLVIVCDSIDDKAHAAIIANMKRGTHPVISINAPRYGDEKRDIMEDLCVATGATMISLMNNLQSESDVQLKLLGHSAKVIAGIKQTTFIDNKGSQSEIDKRVELLQRLLENATGVAEQVKLEERISRLSSGIAVIKVGGETEIDAIERKHRIEDAIEAIKAARDGGYVAGGGSVFIRIANSISNADIQFDNEYQRIASHLLRDALLQPSRFLFENASQSLEVVSGQILNHEYPYGFNVHTEEYGDLLEIGVVEPTKVLTEALSNAISVAGTLITTAHSLNKNEE